MTRLYSPPMIVLTVAIACAAAPRPAFAAGIASVAADERSLAIAFDGVTDRPAHLIEQDVYAPDGPVASRGVVWRGPAGSRSAAVDRFDGPRDRLYGRFTLIDDATGQPLGPPRFVTDLTTLQRADFPMPRPTGKKGLQCIVDIDDALALGVKHTALNVDLPALVDPTPGTDRSPLTWSVDGRTIHLSEHAVERLDRQVERYTAAGVRVGLILLAYPKRDSPLIHPDFDRANPHATIAAFNLTDEAGYTLYRGLVEFLAHRYSRPGAPHGSVAYYIIGNEVNSHFVWYNLGAADLSRVVEQYARAVRVADLAVRRWHTEPRVMISLEHNWSIPFNGDARQTLPGRVLLDRLAARLAAQGDIPWQLAYHPYPENLADPTTWDDASATYAFDTPRITFRNVEVIAAYMKRPEMLFDGRPRRVLLTEQGFHRPDTPDGDDLQAAGFAFAFYRIDRIDGIDAFILHRHVDHTGEFGLRLGLRANVPGTVTDPGEKRRIYTVFRDADSPRWRDAFDFALPIIGIDDWAKADPQTIRAE